MTLYERMKSLQEIFNRLECTPGRNDKIYIVNKFCEDADLRKDFMYCLEVLTGKHKLGFKLPCSIQKVAVDDHTEITIEEFCQPLFNYSKSDYDQQKLTERYSEYLWFLTPLFNRTWRLGINKSLLSIDKILAPMLAKKFNPDKIPKAKEYYITQKLDGNRCCAYFDGNQWQFISRAGKPLKVIFDMSQLDRENVYDGEILSRDQLLHPSQENFNKLSGIVNSIDGDKSSLVYVIFDIKKDITYKNRRFELDHLHCESKNVQILPIIEKCNADNIEERALYWLREVTSKGGEGIMINLGERLYEPKRTDALLKYKDVFSMDMKVMSIIPGTGKNEGLVGSLECYAYDSEKDIKYLCSVGSGIEDYLRERWTAYPEEILNKIVEVAYFSVSKASNREDNRLSLRFPRFIRVRDDKTNTSVD